jgi:ribosomal protein L11 methylase PrmA
MTISRPMVRRELPSGYRPRLKSGMTAVRSQAMTITLDYPRKVLDLGCGDGTTALPAARLGADVLAVDIASNLVEAGNNVQREQGHAARPSSAIATMRSEVKVYSAYYNATRTHLGIDKDAPNSRPIERCGVIVANAVLGGLHHRSARI